ncbi:MAG: SPOR domain-containing protein [Acidiferrobacteraceae bacterium]
MSGSEGRVFKPIHRMVGAVALVVLAVVLLPMIFRPRPQTIVTVAPLGKTQPPPVSAPVHTGRVQALSSSAPVMTTSAASAPAPAAAPVPAPSSTPTVPAAQIPAPTPVKQVAVPAPPQKVLRTRVAPMRGWFVQVAAFSRERAAFVLAHRFVVHGFPAHVERERVRGHTYFQMRLGPYRDRPDALHAQRRIVTVWPRGRTLLVYSRR